MTQLLILVETRKLKNLGKNFDTLLNLFLRFFDSLLKDSLSSDEEVGDEDGDDVRGQGQEDLGTAGAQQFSSI